MIRFLTPVVVALTLCGMWAGWPSSPTSAEAGSQGVGARDAAARVRTARAANTTTRELGVLTGREIPLRGEPAETQSAEADSERADAALAREPGEWVTFVATAYCCCKKCCGRNACGITASGHKLRVGDRVVAVDPKVIPLRSQLEVAGMGRYQALDTGSAIKGNRIDIWMHSHQEALEFGRRTVQLRVLELGRKPGSPSRSSRATK